MSMSFGEIDTRIESSEIGLSPDSYSRPQSSPSDSFEKKVTEVVVNKVPYRGTRQFVRHMLLTHGADRKATRFFRGRATPSEDAHLTGVELKWARFVNAEIAYPSLGGRAWMPLLKAHEGIARLLKIPALEPIAELAQIEKKESEQEASDANSKPDSLAVSTTETRFKVSDELVTHWIEGLNANLSESNQPTISVRLALQDRKYAEELGKQIRTIINNFAKRKAYEGGRYRISFGGRLYPSVESLFVDHLMLPPRNAVVFLDELRTQLFEQSKDGPVFHGRWGRLLIDDANELVLSLEKRRSRKLSKVLKG